MKLADLEWSTGTVKNNNKKRTRESGKQGQKKSAPKKNKKICLSSYLVPVGIGRSVICKPPARRKFRGMHDRVQGGATVSRVTGRRLHVYVSCNKGGFFFKHKANRRRSRVNSNRDVGQPAFQSSGASAPAYSPRGRHAPWARTADLDDSEQ